MRTVRISKSALTDYEPLVRGQRGEGLLEVLHAALVARVERVVPRRLLPRHRVRARQRRRRRLQQQREGQNLKSIRNPQIYQLSYIS